METKIDQQTRTESKTRLVEQINVCLRSGDYARALDLLGPGAAEFPNNAELSELERLAQEGSKRKAEADRLITESQDLFAQQRSADAIQLLRKAYDLDKRNSLARAILANALVEHAQSIAESDWLEAEKLTNQALNLNPAHPTAKTILSLIVERKTASSAEDWVSQARKLQSSGDLFAALAWVAEGLAVHPHEPKLLQIQDAIQRDQDTRRRQARRGDLDELRSLQREIDAAADIAAKQALAARIQAVAAKHWTDGEILSIANALLLRLGLVPQEGPGASARNKGATVILHVPRPSTPEAPAVDSGRSSTSSVPPSQVPPSAAALSEASQSPISRPKISPIPVLPGNAQTPAAENSGAGVAPRKEAPPKAAPANRVPVAPTAPKAVPPGTVTIPAIEARAPVARVTDRSSQQKRARTSNSKIVLFVSAGAAIVFAAVLFLARGHRSVPVASAPAGPAASTPAVAAPSTSAPLASAPAEPASEASPPAAQPSSDTSVGRMTINDRSPGGVTPTPAPGTFPELAHNLGTLVIATGQDDATVFLNGKPQRQLTRAGELRLPNLVPNDYVVQVSKSGFEDPPQQTIRIRKGEEARLIFNLQPQPRLASLMIQGAAPATTVLVDQTSVGNILPDGTLSVSNVSPGDHTVELRKERFKPRQFKKHFVAGGTITLGAADAALEPAPSELKVTFTPADAQVAVVKGELLKIVSSGVPLNLAPGTYTLTARTAERFTRSATIEVVAGQSRTLDLSLAPSGMSKWDDPGAWKPEGDSFIRKGGDFVLYGAVPTSGTFVFSALPARGRLLQWVLNYTDARNYVLLQMDDNNFYRSVIRNGVKSDEIIVPHKGEKKSYRTLQIRVSPTEIVHQIKRGESWIVLDRWTQPGTNLSLGKFGFYIPGNDEVALSGLAHYADLTLR